MGSVANGALKRGRFKVGVLSESTADFFEPRPSPGASSSRCAGCPDRGSPGRHVQHACDGGKRTVFWGPPGLSHVNSFTPHVPRAFFKRGPFLLVVVVEPPAFLADERQAAGLTRSKKKEKQRPLGTFV